MQLTAEKIILREFTEADFEAVHAYAAVPENVRYMVWGPNDEAATKAFISSCIERAGKTPRTQYDFAIVLKETQKVIGGCGIYLKNELLEAEIGWILHRDYWKQGLMPQAGLLLLGFGFEQLGLHRIYATCNAENYGSYRVMEKCGMRKEAHFLQNRHGYAGDKEKWYDEYHYAMLEEEWKSRQKEK